MIGYIVEAINNYFLRSEKTIKKICMLKEKKTGIPVTFKVIKYEAWKLANHTLCGISSRPT
jgi:hypothetical protein